MAKIEFWKSMVMVGPTDPVSVQRVTTEQRNVLNDVLYGTEVWNIDTHQYEVYTPVGWGGYETTVRVRTYEDVEALADRPSMVLIESYLSSLDGDNTPNDGGGGWFYWAPGCSMAPDNINIITPTGEPAGRYLRVHASPARISTAQRNAIASPTTGLLIFNTDTTKFEYYSGISWDQVGDGAGSSSEVDFTEALNWEIGIDNLSGYWKFDEADGSTAHDSSNFALSSSSLAGLFGKPSAINDGRTALEVNGESHIPYHEGYFGKGYMTTMGFIVSLQHDNDFVSVDMCSSNGIMLEIYIQADHTCSASIMNTDDGEWLTARLDNPIQMGGRALVVVTVDFNGSLVFRINEYKDYAHFTGAVGTRREDSGTGFGDDLAGIHLNGGEICPRVSHLFIVPWYLEDYPYAGLLGATGLANHAMVRTQVPALVSPTSLYEIGVLIGTNADLFWALDDYHSPYLPIMGGNWTLLANGYQTPKSPFPINDGGTGLYIEGTLSLKGYYAPHYDSADLTIGYVFQSFWSTARASLDITHLGTESRWYPRAKLSVSSTDGLVHGVLYNTDGIVYLSAVSPIRVMPGGIAVLFLSYNHNTDTMILSVNGTNTVVRGGTGTLQTSIPYGTYIASNPSLIMTASGGIGRVVTSTYATTVDDLQEIMALSGLQNSDYVLRDMSLNLVSTTVPLIAQDSLLVNTAASGTQLVSLPALTKAILGRTVNVYAIATPVGGGHANTVFGPREKIYGGGSATTAFLPTAPTAAGGDAFENEYSDIQMGGGANTIY